MTLTTPDDWCKVAAFYREKLTTNRMVIGMDVNAPETLILSAEREANKATILASPQDRVTSIIVSFSKL